MPPDTAPNGDQDHVTDSAARRARRLYKAMFVIGAVLLLASFGYAAFALGVVALLCAALAAWGSGWMVLTLLAASKDPNLD